MWVNVFATKVFTIMAKIKNACCAILLAKLAHKGQIQDVNNVMKDICSGPQTRRNNVNNVIIIAKIAWELNNRIACPVNRNTFYKRINHRI